MRISKSGGEHAVFRIRSQGINTDAQRRRAAGVRQKQNFIGRMIGGPGDYLGAKKGEQRVAGRMAFDVGELNGGLAIPKAKLDETESGRKRVVEGGEKRLGQSCRGGAEQFRGNGRKGNDVTEGAIGVVPIWPTLLPVI